MIEGKTWKLEHNVDTDVIIPGTYLNMQDPEMLSQHCFEGLGNDFVKKISPGDIIVAGRNFGCGSSREQAPVAIKGAGIKAIVALSFARIFYRNAINIGLPIFESQELYDDLTEGDVIRILDSEGAIVNISTGRSFLIVKFPESIQNIVSCGGLINYGKKRIASSAP
jgi:3-isopropylmalate/(R)-2-methylmalate dehydratase small subunit